MTVTITNQGNPINIAADSQTISVNVTSYDTSAAATTAAASASVDAAAAAASAAQAALYDGPWLDDVTAVLSDTSFAYTAAPGKTVVTVGGYLLTRKDGLSYQFASSGASDQDVTTAGGVKMYVMPSEDGYYPLRAFGITSAARLATVLTKMSGKPLDWGNEQISLASAVSVTIAKIDWRANGAVLTYTGGVAIAALLTIVASDANDHAIVGSGLMFDGSGLSGRGILISQPLGTVTASIFAENLQAKNCELIVGAGTSSCGILVSGGWKKVHLHAPNVKNIRCQTGAAIPGTRGVQGILVSRSGAGAYPVDILITDPTVENVYPQDVTQQFDMDGISVLSNPDIDYVHGPSQCRIVNSTIINCWGRDIKTQCAHTEVVTPSSRTTVGPTAGKQHPLIDVQSGTGAVFGGRYDILNTAFTATGGVVRFAFGAQMSPGTGTWDGGCVTLRGTASMAHVLFLDADAPEKFTVVAKGQTVNGAIQDFGYIRTNGFDLHTMILEGQVVNLTDALFRTEARSGGVAPYRSRVIARNVVNVGTTCAMSRQLVSGLSSWCLSSSDNCTGFTEASLHAATAATNPVGRFEGVTFSQYIAPDGFGYVQGRKEFSYGLANGANFTLPLWGDSGSCLVDIKISANDRNAYARLSMDAGGIVNIAVGTSFNIGTTSDPGSGSYRVWRSGSQLVLQNNSGSTRYMTIIMQG